MDDPFDRWESEFDEDENARVHRIMEDHAANSEPGSGNPCQLEWIRRRFRRDR